MKINAIGATTFGNKQQILKKAATGFIAAAGAGLAADTFVKGISKPSNKIEKVDEDVIRANDDPNGWNPCDNACDAACSPSQENQKKFENDPCSCENC